MTFRITGLGKYRMRNGEVDTIIENDGLDWPWIAASTRSYRDDGLEFGPSNPGDNDIVARVDEPVAESAGLTGYVALTQGAWPEALGVYLDMSGIETWHCVIDLSTLTTANLVKPVKREGWVNVYRRGDTDARWLTCSPCVFYQNRRDADAYQTDMTRGERIACIPVSFVEGEGLSNG